MSITVSITVRTASVTARSTAAALLVLGLGACSVTSEPDDSTATDSGTTDGAATHTATPSSSQGEAGAYALALLATPADATHLTVTDYDAIRTRLGVPDLTSQDLMTDRLEFWRAVDSSTVQLTDGLLREEYSRFDRTYDFTQDDVDAEVHWNGPSASGFLLAFRPDLDLDLVEAAVDDQAPGLQAATLDRPTATVSSRITSGAVWASDPLLAAVGDVRAESLIVHHGCVPFTEALGIDATVEDQDAVLGKHDVAALLDVEAVAIAFTADTAAVRLAYPADTMADAIESDVAARLALADDWPTTESIGFDDGYGEGTVTGAHGTVGQLTYAVKNPIAAANLALADLVPLGVCTDVELLAEPTGL